MDDAICAQVQALVHQLPLPVLRNFNLPLVTFPNIVYRGKKFIVLFGS